MIIDGKKGGIVELINEHVVIRRYGLLSAINVGLQGEKRIRIVDISAVQLKEAGLFTAGYIHFSFFGGREIQGGLLAHVEDENSVLFHKLFNEPMKRFRDEVERRISALRAAPGRSIGDEIHKLAELRDRGILTADEFEAGKARLLKS